MGIKSQLIEDLDSSLKKLNNINIDDGLEPFINMKNMTLSINKIKKYINENKKIKLVGDYDVDGIVATTIVISFFKDHPNLNEQNISYFIPDRMIHGYGVSPLIVEECKKENIDLIITVDNGISAISAIDKAIELGIDVIITDHHTVPKIIPNIDTIINPKFDENLEYKEISGATVAWCFCSALNRILDTQIDMYKYLDLAALTVLSDVIPLSNVNRPLLQHGFNVIDNSERELYTKLFSPMQRKNLSSSDIGFNLVPKINATGRLANANLGVELLLTKDIAPILSQIENINEERKDLTHNQFQLILEDAAIQNEKYNCIVVFNDNLHEGVVGILASKLVELYKKPSFVLTKHHNEYKGSARSIGKISVYELLNNQQQYLLKFGGHAGAAGLGLLKENIEHLRNGMHKDLEENYTLEDYKQDVFFYELDSMTDLNLDLAKLLQNYEPFGSKFERPQFKIYVKIIGIEKNIDNKHYLCTIKDKLHNKRNIWFYHFSEEMVKFINQPLYIMVDVGLNFWNGNQSIVYRGKLI